MLETMWYIIKFLAGSIAIMLLATVLLAAISEFLDKIFKNNKRNN